MNKYKVKYTLNEKLHWTNILAENEHNAAKNVYKQISEEYPDDDYEYMDVELDVDDDEVTEGASFITDGYEYKWIGRMGDSVYLDFDHWAVWAAENQDTNEIQFFIVEEDTGFIDWGPVDNAKEAAEFLQSKIDEYNQDESLVENSNNNTYNINEDIEMNDTFHLTGNVKIIFYEVDGKCPVAEFLDSISNLKLRAKVIKDMDKLSNLGHNAREPFSRYEGDGIFELATKQSNNITRIFYFFNYGNQVIMTNGYEKHSQKRDEGEFEKAKKYRDEYIERGRK